MTRREPRLSVNVNDDGAAQSCAWSKYVKFAFCFIYASFLCALLSLLRFENDGGAAICTAERSLPLTVILLPRQILSCSLTWKSKVSFSMGINYACRLKE